MEEQEATTEDRLRRRALREKEEREALEREAVAKMKAEGEAWKAEALAKHQELQMEVDEDRVPESLDKSEDHKETREMLESSSPYDHNESQEEGTESDPDAAVAASSTVPEPKPGDDSQGVTEPPSKKQRRRRGQRKTPRPGRKERAEHRRNIAGQESSADYEEQEIPGPEQEIP